MAAVEHSTKGEKVFNVVNLLILALLTVIFFYPMWHCLMASFSDPESLIGYNGLLTVPMGFSLKGYSAVLNNSNIAVGYANTLFYVGIGTLLNMILTILGAYVLSRRNLMFKVPLTLLIVFTMYFDFGLIPNFLNIRDLGP